MIEIDQVVCNFKTGDCMRACVASIFELPISYVPNFMEDGLTRYNKKLKVWLLDIGLSAVDILVDEQHKNILDNIYSVAVGISPRDPKGEVYHGVVWFNGEIVHDPHPDKTGIVGYPKLFTIFVVNNLAGYKNLAPLKKGKN